MTEFQQSPKFDHVKPTKVAQKRGRKPKKLPVCDFKAIIKPLRFINPYHFYKVNSLLVVGEEDRSIFFSLEFMNTSKKVSHIELSTPFKEVVTVYLEDTPSIQTVPYEYLIARLKSFGDVESYDWAKTIEKYDEDYNKDLKGVVSGSVPCNALIKPEENIQEWLLEKPSSWLNYKYTEDDLQLESISFSNSLLTTLRYSLSKFMKVCFEEGIPKIFKVSEDRRLSGKYIFRKLFFPNFNRVDYGKPCEIYDAFGSLTPAFETKGSICKIMPDGSVEAMHYVKFDVKNYSSNSGESIIEENPNYMDLLQTNSKILLDFLKKSEYTHKRSHEKVVNEVKPCKVRDLSTEESNDVCKKLHIPENENESESESESFQKKL